MRLVYWIGGTLLALVLFAAPQSAQAQEQSCLWEGQTYPEMSTICQNGLLQTCINGDWQNNGGERCDDEDDD